MTLQFLSSFYRNLYSGGGSGGHGFRDVSVEDVAPHRTVMGKKQWNRRTSPLSYHKLLCCLMWRLLLVSLNMQVADAMEMMILSILGPQLHCEWRLPSYQVALVTSVKPRLVLLYSLKHVGLVSVCVNVCAQLLFPVFASGGVHRDGDRLTCVGECVRQVWQKNCES